jgi:hypothetical protein
MAIKEKVFEYTEENGRKYPVIRRKNKKSPCIPCPFCGKGHIHGTGDGHRVAHCQPGVAIEHPDGTICSSNQGYVVISNEDNE